MRLRELQFFSLLFFAIFTALSTFYVTNIASAASPSSILVSMVPQNPAPNEDVSISLNSYVSNLDTVSISWSVDGKVVSSGIGRKSLTLTAPSAGSETIVRVTIFLPDGSIEKRINVRPSVMTLLWQANDAYVHPFYKGKALPTPESEIKVVAIPDARTGTGNINPKSMTYAWEKDYTNEVGSSGYGKDAFFYVNDYLENSNNISVTASSIDQRYSSQANIEITTTEPKILFYENDPNLGTLWERALPSPFKVEESAIIEAVPYFISPNNTDSPRLVWNWSINDRAIGTSSSLKKNFLPLRVESGTSGTSRIKLQINNIDKIFQTVNREINVEF